MQIRHNDIEIPKHNPFANCKLDREKYAVILSQIVASFPQGFTLAINNEWGAGKTTFVKMWKQKLMNEGYRTVYFNSWENDFSDDPMVSIVSELKTLTGNNDQKKFKKMAEKGAALAKNIVPALVKGLVNRHVDSETVREILNETSKSAAGLFEKEVIAYAKKKQSAIDFRKELAEFVKMPGDQKPVVFILDELDRCRPNYAVSVLECLKHFFSVEGIVFVLSIDKSELANSVRGYYGSDRINSEEYLRRFIDLDFSIPRPSNRIFCNYLYGYFNLSSFIESGQRQSNVHQNDRHLLLEMAVKLFDRYETSLRQQEKIFGLTRLVLFSFYPNQYIFPHLLFFLIYLKVLRPDIYGKIRSKQYSYQGLADEFYSLLPDIEDQYARVSIEKMMALLLHFYHNSRNIFNREDIFNTGADGKKVPAIRSKYESDKNSPKLLENLNAIAGRSDYYDVKLDYLLERIDLTQPIII